MIIVSQDKKVITNFDNTLGIQIEETIINADGEKDYGIKTITEKRTCGIGIYATEERAKEVLQEIVMLFKDEEMFHIRKSTLNNLDELAEPKYILKPVCRPKVYEMPKE